MATLYIRNIDPETVKAIKRLALDAGLTLAKLLERDYGQTQRT